MADYFSRLLEPLTHHILSFLPFKEIGRTCVLSKYWNSIWCNYPNLDFYMVEKDVNNWAKENPEKAIFDYVENSFDKFLDARPFIQKFCLQIECCTMGRGLTRKLDRWLRVSVDKNVSRLVLITKYLWSPFRYSVPQHVFIAPTLEVLDLFWCTLDTDRIVHIDLPRLEMLSLSGFQVINCCRRLCVVALRTLLQKSRLGGLGTCLGVLGARLGALGALGGPQAPRGRLAIFSTLPKSEHIVISWCRGGQPMRSIYVPKLVFVAMRLGVLDLSGCTLEEHHFVGIEFPCLERLFFKNRKFVGNNLLERILSACGPSMKHISIYWCKGIRTSLSVSCKPLLKGFFFLRCDDEFERIKIDTPSLRAFSYESTNAACVIDLTSCTNLKNLYGSIGKSLNHPASALLLHKI